MKKIAVSHKHLIAACVLTALPLAALAGDGAYVGTEGGVNFEKSQAGISFNTGWIAGLTAGYAFESGWRPELEVDFRRNEIDAASGGGGHTTATSAMGNIWYDIKTNSGLFSVLHPYIGVGIGYAHPNLRSSLANAQEDRFAYQAGGGIGYDITRHLTASLDYRFLRDSHDIVAGTEVRYQTQAVMLGLRYAFGIAPSAAAPVAAAMPVAASAARPGVLDADGDGVPDSLDKCAHTPRGFHVDANGCIIHQTVILQGVNFEYNSDQLTAPSRSTLDEVAEALKGQPDLNVEIGGYTDSIGSKSYNEHLSKKRAEAVRSYLAGKGVNHNNLTAKGFGEEHPVASNKTAEGRAQNRRVEFVVLSKSKTVKVINKAPSEQSRKAAVKAKKKK